jgi:hypothetical protein
MIMNIDIIGLVDFIMVCFIEIEMNEKALKLKK